MTIRRFRGQYRFLSNFYLCRVEYEGRVYRSVEHAYQSAKATNEADRKKVANSLEPAHAKSIGGRIQLRKGWGKMKRKVMLACLRSKFQDKELRNWLVETAPHDLVEGNFHGDDYWGVCPSAGDPNYMRGSNHLGRLLMKVRDEIMEAQ